MTRPTYRRLAAFLALVLCPILVLAGTSPAQAVDDFGVKDSWKWEAAGDKHGYPGIDLKIAMSCNASGYAVGNGTSLGAKGRVSCSWEWNGPDSDWTDADVSGSISLSGNAVGTNQSCEYSGNFAPQPATLAAGTAWSAFGTSVATCAITQACFNYEVDHDNFGPFDASFSYEACADVDLPPPDYAGGGSSGTCASGNPRSVDFAEQAMTGQPSYHQHLLDIIFKEGSPNHAWIVTFLSSPTQTEQTFTTDTKAMPGWQAQSVYNYWPNGTSDPQIGAPSGHIKGVMIALKSRGLAPGEYGLTSATDCYFYIGQKIRDTPTDTKDEPYLPLDGSEAPEGTPEPTADVEPVGNAGCVFKVSDPSTWATGALCALVGLVQTMVSLLADLLSLVGGLAAAISAAFGALLQTLFIPDDLGGPIDELFDTMQTRPPFSVMADLGQGAASMADGYSGGSCGTLLNLGGDLTVTCADVRGVPGFGALYALAQIALWSMTALGCWKLVSNLFQDGQ